MRNNAICDVSECAKTIRYFWMELQERTPFEENWKKSTGKTNEFPNVSVNANQ